jgi:hypothetical protein
MNYVQIMGSILGMLLFGSLADILGRRWGRCGGRTAVGSI